MKRKYVKTAIATGYFSILGMFFIALIFITAEYNLLSKEYAGLFSPKEQFNIHKPQEISVRNLTIEGKAAEKIPILTNHRIIKSSDITKHHYINNEVNPMIVTKENFEKQMTFLKDNDYVTLTMQELYLFLSKEIEIPEKSVVLTFDDGYKDNFIEAYPLLKKYDFSAVTLLLQGLSLKEFIFLIQTICSILV